MLPNFRILVGMLALALVGAPAFAQDARNLPNYGSINLAAGFSPDTRLMKVAAGGSINASGLGRNCVGFIASAPDVRMKYTASNVPLTISVDATADTILVINGPDGSWTCDDNGGSKRLNPSIRFNRPITGGYDIWVGTRLKVGTPVALLYVSQTRSQ